MVEKRYKGRDVLLYRGNGDGPPETFTKVGGLKTTDLSIDNKSIDVTDKNDGQWMTLLSGGIKSMAISLAGVISDDVTIRNLQDDIYDLTGIARDLRNFQMKFGNLDIITCAFQITKFQRAGAFGGEETYTISLASSGTPTVVRGP